MRKDLNNSPFTRAMSQIPFLYVNFSDPDRFMDGLSDYVLSEANLINYANTRSPIAFTPTLANYKKLYSTLETFLNAEMELLTFDNISNEVKDTLGDEYNFINKNGETLIQKDKIGKIGEYIFHVLLSPSKKMLKDMGIYDGDIDQIVAVIGEDFTSIAELQHLLKEHIEELGEISIVSRYIINRLLN